MSRLHARLAPSYLALLTAAGLAAASPALAATTTITVPEDTTQTSAITASPAAGDTVIVEVDGMLSFGPTSAMVNGSGAGAVIINIDGQILGRVNFPSATGPVTVNVNSGEDPMTQGWHTGGSVTFGAGDDTVNNTAEGTIAVNGATTFAFGAGTDTFNNAGRFITERQSFQFLPGMLTITGLEAFNNSGVIMLGSVFNGAEYTGEVTDGVPNDSLTMSSGTFTGLEGSRIMLDVDFSKGTQESCAALVSADCLNFTGATTAGTTLLTAVHAHANARDFPLGASITVVMGASAAEHFLLDPASDDYTTESFGEALQKGLLAFRLVYDEDTMQHRLVSVLSDEAVWTPQLAAPAQDAWRSTSDALLTRQSELRARGGEVSRGVWGRIGGGRAERDSAVSLDAGGMTTDYDTGYEQSIGHLTFGADVLGGATDNGGWALGVALGVVRALVEPVAGQSETDYSGFTGGLYGSYGAGPFFIDGLVNANLMDVATDAPRLNLGEEVKLETRAKSLGGQVEAGWRFDLSPGLFLEPLAGVSYVKTELEDIDIADDSAMLDFDDTYTSLRIGAGLRLGLATELAGLATSFALTGRYWDEQEGENASSVFVANGESTVDLVDAYAGSFSEVNGSVSVGVGEMVSIFAKVGGAFGDDYQSTDAALGVRLTW